MQVAEIQIHQGILEKAVSSLFPKENVISSARKQVQIPTATGLYFEIDVWVPRLQLGFEFQDSYHYVSEWYSHRPLEVVQKTDDIKRDLVNSAYITLVQVPCWWDGSLKSLAATVMYHRPELSLNYVAMPISLNPRQGFFEGVKLPFVGSLMPASFPNDHSFSRNVNPNTWWLGEKYDGIRCYWNPSQRQVYSRKGKKVTLAPAILDSLPDLLYIDGEIWFGRGMYLESFLLVVERSNATFWPTMRLISFDVPHATSRRQPYELRYASLLNLPEETITYVVAPRLLCKGHRHLKSALLNLIDQEGKGVILCRVGSQYKRDRNSDLMKIKATFGDNEGLIVAVDANSVSLKLPNGLIVPVPSHSVHISNPTVGEVVSFSYDKLARRDVPVNPEIFRERPDLEWEGKAVQTNVPRDSQTYTTKPKGFWTLHNMREFLKNIANKFNLDPFQAVTWSKIPLKAVLDSKGGRIIVKKYKNLSNALMALFPTIGLSNASKSDWHLAEKRRQFFEDYARKAGFDFRSCNAWYSQSMENIKAEKGAAGVIWYHNQSVTKALLDLFPDIGLEEDGFKLKLSPWQSQRQRRNFFEAFAKENEFDPLSADAWYTQSLKKIRELKGAIGVIWYHNQSVVRALMDLFPNIGLQEQKFKQQKSPWHLLDHRKQFFVNYASQNGFDSQSADAWYAQSLQKIRAVKGAGAVLRYYNGSIVSALLNLFPNIGLQASNFNAKLSPWHYPKKQRQFFENYAIENGFDASSADRWYAQSLKKIRDAKGANSVLCYHNGSVVKALLHLFPDIGLQEKKFRLKFSKPK